ncbi:NIF-domain-containing protein [Hysterangium stoloniferum]|nr:NIF-domain-containing protein [Hysterangium stoloniferum]
MNSLAYLSRQFDVLASARTPPSTPTSEKTNVFSPTKSDSRSTIEHNLKRTQTWNKLFTESSNLSEGTLSTKRSFSLPAFTAPLLNDLNSSGPISSSVSKEGKSSRRYQRLRRFYFVRTLVLIWNAVCEAWINVVNGRIRSTRDEKRKLGVDSDAEDAISAEEKDSEESDEIDPIVTRTLRKPLADSRDHAQSDHMLEDSYTFTSGTSSSALHSSQLFLIPSPAYPKSQEPLPAVHSKSSNLLPNPFSTSLLTQSPSQPSPSRPSSPTSTPSISPRKTPFHFPKTLVLDLDETLIHSTSRPLIGHGTGGTGLLGLGGRRNKGAGHMVEVVLGGRSTLYHVYKRPFVDYFLRKVSSWYTLVIFTASMQEYADPVIDWLDAGRGILGRRFFRESCTQLPTGSYTKDLSLVEADLSRVCLVDNSPISYNVNQANGIPIEGWTHDMSDEALLDLLPVLDSLRFTSDVRRVLGMRGF